MNRIKGLALGLGLAALMVVGLACGAGEKQEPSEAEPASDAPQAQGQPGPSGSPAGDTAPPIPHGAPLVNLTYEGAVYYQTLSEQTKRRISRRTILSSSAQLPNRISSHPGVARA